MLKVRVTAESISILSMITSVKNDNKINILHSYDFLKKISFFKVFFQFHAVLFYHETSESILYLMLTILQIMFLAFPCIEQPLSSPDHYKGLTTVLVIRDIKYIKPEFALLSTQLVTCNTRGGERVCQR